MISKSSNYNENYLAKVISLGEPTKHPNADRLQGFVIDGNRIWTDMTRKKGDLGVYFPLECQLNADLLKALNLYSDSTLNSDPVAKGYFDKNGRVRAVRLRGEPSQGIFLTIEEITAALGSPGGYAIGEEFDTWQKILICKKYVPPVAQRTAERDPKAKKVPRKSRLIEGQFKLHESTAQLKKNMDQIDPHDLISITYKLHGTSWVVGKVLTKRKLPWYEKALKWLGINITPDLYDIIYSSRTVVKNQYENQKNNHFYGTDTWEDIKKVVEGSLMNGITLYGEAVGFTRTGRPIQGKYDYGYKSPFSGTYKEGEHFGVFIYRITHTNNNGKTIELSWPQIKEYCDFYGLKHVPEIYYGLAKDWKSDISTEEHWHTNVLENLSSTYLEWDCHMCKNKVPAEGIVVRPDNLFNFKAYKLKSFRFLEHETKELDKGEVDMETAESDGATQAES